MAVVDDEDFESVSGIKWRINKQKEVSYALSRSGYLHRFIMGNPSGMVVDHINHNGLDCRRSNLRVCTRSQNAMNRNGPRRNTISGVRGVTFRKGRFTAAINVGGISKHLGNFHSAYEASEAYQSANRKFFGEFGGKF